jgi:hypothetical protein
MENLVASDERNGVWLELAATTNISFGDECARGARAMLRSRRIVRG